MKKEQIPYNVVRLALGLLLLSSVTLLVVRGQPEDSQSGLKSVISACFWDTGYLMHLVKGIEFIVAISLLANRYVRFTLLLFCPVMVNIILFDLFADNVQGLKVALPMAFATGYLIYYHRAYYEPLFYKR